ncbi:hypothetical protein BO70DRAFT_405574 [Aspergillus heteromorphus CBS 117.55]|uniref:Uncharacterized protein n=1 Tax=Aspergillus heteromorphus CBS 117.55 TaxID=1448321 RepID=A0A317W811_9EURO|nr:uncharacterized protein BO70DRAFT_405574 [Aspergillus heteromorphus CBS 117.55]PWY82229.1 hypothetical protein BO70DRAFT_405574 [Aspergillus heteromorphus CBS 117.55]
MSSTDYQPIGTPLKPQYNNHHHNMSANTAPSFVNRSVPSYCVTGEEPMAPGNNSPRYSPNVQPWKRQQAQSSLSFVRSTSPRPEQSEYTTSQSRRPAERPSVYMSPFRSVRRMKQPFQLRLPSSPSLENIASAAKESRLSRQVSGGPTLRAWRSDQNLNVTSIDSFGLLPSPPLSDSLGSQSSPSSAYFSPKPESVSEYGQTTPRGCACIPDKESCNDCSPRQQMDQLETPKQQEKTTNVHMAHSKLVRHCDSSDGQLTPASTTSESIPSPAPSSGFESFGKRSTSGSSTGTQRSRSGTVSSEGSWVPSSLSYCGDWLQGAPVETAEIPGERSREQNRRKCQIVQKSPQRLKAPDKAVMFAVASKTKPKLVDISRQSSPAMSYSLPTPPHPIPSTPDLGQQEISAFSPDTPMDMSDSGYITHHSCSSPDGFRDDKDDDDYTDADSASESGGETVICKKPTQIHINPKSTPKSTPKPDLPPKFSTSPKIQTSPGRSSVTSEKEELEKWWDHEWTIDQLEHSVKDFPRNMLRLTSPVIMFIRHNNEKALLRPFRSIFPNVAENLLDGLCASLIARNYVVSLASTNRKTNNFSHRTNLARLDTVPEKAASSAGVQFSPATPSRIKERVLGSRSLELRKDLDRIVDNLLFAICGRADETLKSAVLVLAQVLETKN